MCNFCAADEEAECNYTPKKRQRSGAASVAPQRHKHETGSHSVSSQINPSDSPSKLDRHTFYGQNIASSSRKNNQSPSPSPSDLEGSSDPDIPLYVQTGRSATEQRKNVGSEHSGLHSLVTRHAHAQQNSMAFKSQPFSASKGLLIKSSTVEPWNDMSFVPLPGYIIQRLSLINSVEIPDRRLFDEALHEFLAGVMGELRETACLTPEVYSIVSHALKAGNNSKLSERLHAWVSFHHVCSGSEKRHLLILPRDSIFAVETIEAQRLRQDYLAHIEEQLQMKATSPSSSMTDSASCGINKETYFDRVPVQPQIYDVLTYVHRSHDPPLNMIAEIKQLGFETHATIGFRSARHPMNHAV